MAIRTVGVIGAGQMGSGIVQVAASAGYDVLMQDISDEALRRAVSGIEKSLGKLVEKGKLAADLAEGAKARVKTVRTMEDLASADLVIEAVTENPAIKFEIFKRLDAACKKEAILASNTSSISITEIAAKTKRPGQVIGMHFMNPVPIMQLVEVIRGIATDDVCFAETKACSEKMGKTVVEARDYPGFVVNRILMPMINEAVYALYEGLATEKDIDAAMKLGTNQPMGPLTLADFIGLDTCLAIMNVLHDGLGDSKYRPCPLLKNYVAAGWLGRKAGRGFYTYDV